MFRTTLYGAYIAALFQELMQPYVYVETTPPTYVLSFPIQALGSSRSWNHITDQIGMFCYTGLDKDAVRDDGCILLCF